MFPFSYCEGPENHHEEKNDQPDARNCVQEDGVLYLGKEVKVHTKGGEALVVYFKFYRNKFSNVWLEGKANIVFKGEFLYHYCEGGR